MADQELTSDIEAQAQKRQLEDMIERLNFLNHTVGDPDEVIEERREERGEVPEEVQAHTVAEAKAMLAQRSADWRSRFAELSDTMRPSLARE